VQEEFARHEFPTKYQIFLREERGTGNIYFAPGSVCFLPGWRGNKIKALSKSFHHNIFTWITLCWWMLSEFYMQIRLMALIARDRVLQWNFTLNSICMKPLQSMLSIHDFYHSFHVFSLLSHRKIYGKRQRYLVKNSSLWVECCDVYLNIWLCDSYTYTSKQRHRLQ
jgi:hypothetical protein